MLYYHKNGGLLPIIKPCDFGLAKKLNRNEMQHSIGTNYVAQVIVKNIGHSYEYDIWSSALFYI